MGFSKIGKTIGITKELIRKTSREFIRELIREFIRELIRETIRELIREFIRETIRRRNRRCMIISSPNNGALSPKDGEEIIDTANNKGFSTDVSLVVNQDSSPYNDINSPKN